MNPKINKHLEKTKTIVGKIPKLKLRSKQENKSVYSDNIVNKIKDIWYDIKEFFISLWEKIKHTAPDNFIKMVVLGIVVVYLVSWAIFVFMAYERPDTKTDKENLIKITQRDKIIGSAAKIYPIPVAYVNSSPIWAGEFYSRIKYLKTYSSQVKDSLNNDITSESSLRSNVLNILIEDKIIRQQAAKQKITVSKKEIDTSYKELVNAKGGEEPLKKVLKELYGINPTQFKSFIENEIYKDKINQKLLTQAHLAHLLFTDQSKAESVLDRLKSGEAFDAVASSASEDANSKTKGGDIGWFTRDDLINQFGFEFEQSTFLLSKDQYSGVLKTRYGYQIVKLLDKKGSVDKTFSAWLSGEVKKSKVKKYIK